MGDLMGNLLQGALKRLTAPILDDFKRVAGVEEALKNLQQALTQTRALLRDADQRRIDSEADRIWLRKLEAFAYDADDIVDEFYYSALRYRIEGGGKSGGAAPFDEGATRKRHGRVRTRDKVMRLYNAMVGNGTYKLRHNLAAKIEELTNEFKQVTGSHKELNTRALFAPGAAGNCSLPEGSSTVRRETSSLVSEPYVCGRKDEVKQIVETLLHLDPSCEFQTADSFHCLSSSSSVSSSSSFAADIENTLSVLPILGIAGIGKTTVAQLVYNDDRVKKHFELLMWVCVSNNFNLRRLTRQIYDYVATTEEKSVADSPNLDMIQTNLRLKLVGKRFLLVLDDLWNDARGEWHRLRASLLSGQHGSAVLVTTRHDSVADTIGTMDAVRLQGLSVDDCKELLLRCASTSRDKFKEDICGDEFKEDICRKLVEKIKGVPLAIKTLGNILSSKRTEQWEEILERNLWELQQSEGDILPVLKLSYEDLPQHLKRCFTYCSLFPEDFEFDKLKLVKRWMAQDFIQAQRPTDCLEDIGSSYFDELLNRSFFQKVDKHYTMHTLYHGLSQSVPNNRCVRITEKNSTHHIQDDCLLHMSFSNPNVINLNISNHLRSFVFIREFSTTIDHFSRSLELTDSLFSMLKSLRVLDLRSSSITVLPESLGDLIHLRFLDISQTKVAALPISLAQLYNLQSLELKHCRCLTEIHRGVQSLLNLRHLNASDDLVNTLPGIGRLTSLQELRLFKVSKEEGHRIWELKYLNELRNKLWIRNIQNVETKEEAIHADLKNKKHLLELVLEGCSSSLDSANPQN